jgi:hypothetical protein
MDELLIRVMVGLVRVHDELGERSFEKAAHRALVSIARTVQLDAEEKAGVPDPVHRQVVPFPLPRRLQDNDR